LKGGPIGPAERGRILRTRAARIKRLGHPGHSLNPVRRLPSRRSIGPAQMPMDEIRVLVADDLRRVDQVVVARLASDVALVNEIARYIVAGGGKRLRPLAILLAARACGYEGDRHVEAAAVIEFIHTATLLHDDVVDGSDLRRGRETSNHVWGNSASVLVGDYLYSRAFQLMVSLGDLRIQEVMAN